LKCKLSLAPKLLQKRRTEKSSQNHFVFKCTHRGLTLEIYSHHRNAATVTKSLQFQRRNLINLYKLLANIQVMQPSKLLH